MSAVCTSLRHRRELNEKKEWKTVVNVVEAVFRLDY